MIDKLMIFIFTVLSGLCGALALVVTTPFIKAFCIFSAIVVGIGALNLKIETTNIDKL